MHPVGRRVLVTIVLRAMAVLAIAALAGTSRFAPVTKLSDGARWTLLAIAVAIGIGWVLGYFANTSGLGSHVTTLVIGGVFGALALLYVALLPGAHGVFNGLCAFAVLAAAFVAWEYLMKPGYGLMHRRPYVESEEPAIAKKAPRSPGPP